MSEIREYEHGSMERKMLDAAAAVLNRFTPAKVTVEETWFDFGAKMKWTTLIADCGMGTYQMLYPKLQEELIYADLEQFNEWIEKRVIELNEMVLKAMSAKEVVERNAKERAMK